MEGNPCQKPVTRFRLHKSKGFWFGLAGLVFLLWAWVDSFLHFASAGFLKPGWAMVASYNGHLFGVKEAGAGVNWGRPVAYYERITDGADMLAGLRENRLVEFHTVPHAVVLLVYLLLWSGLLVWRARKYRQEPVREGEA